MTKAFIFHPFILCELCALCGKALGLLFVFFANFVVSARVLPGLPSGAPRARVGAMPAPASFTTRYIRDEEHYAEVLLRAREAKKTLWIGTADLKDVFVMRGRSARPFLGEIADLIEKGVSVRLIHAKEPGPNFRRDFDRYPILATGLERVLCPRVHFKLLIVDLQAAYIGSANLTGAGIGMKSDGKRNFEAGIWTDDPQLVAAAVAQFDSVWMGAHCDGCRRKAFCHDSIL